jgi:hypothetical protein
MLGRSPAERSMMSSASSITSRLRRPRKSILSRPSSSTGFIEYCVTVRWIFWPSGPVPASASWSGTMSVNGRSEMTTAAAWIDALRTIPSRPWATSTICFAVASRATSLASSVPGARQSSKLGGRPCWGSGMSFASLSPIAYSWPSTRAASRVAARGNILPKVMICATRSAPYFSVTYRITRSRPRTEKSMSMSGIDTRSGLRKRSNSRS